jgi:hypothetical protein
MTNNDVRDAIADDLAAIMTRHYGKDAQLAVVLVWYREEDQEVNVVRNGDPSTSVALLADGIKVALGLPQPS